MKEILLILFFALLSIAAKSQSISELESKAEAGDVTSMERSGFPIILPYCISMVEERRKILIKRYTGMRKP